MEPTHTQDWWREYNEAKKAELATVLDTFPEEIRKGLVCASRSLGEETFRFVLTQLAKKCFSLSAKDKGNVVVNFSFLSGGVLYGMTAKQIDDFLRMYAHDLIATPWREKRFRLGVIEMWNTRFRFYIDADFLLEVDDIDKAIKNQYEGVRPMFMKRVYQIIQSVINQTFDKIESGTEKDRQDLLTLVAADASPRLITKNHKLYVKHGHHLHWPKLIVTADTALALHQAIVLELSISPAIIELQTKFGYKFDWKSVMDDRPYRDGKSLRLVGSCKPDKCAICEFKHPKSDPKKRKTDYDNQADMSSQCMVCEGKPRMTEPYLVKKVMTYNGSYNTEYLKMLYEKPSMSVQLLSVSCKEGDIEPEPNLVFLKDKYNISLSLGISGITQVTKEKIAKTKQARLTRIDDDIRKEIEYKDQFKSIEDVPEELQAQIHTLAKHVETSYNFDCDPWKVKKVKIGWRNFGDGVKDVVYYLFTDCHFCMNLGGCHSNRVIYFEATSEGIAQRCTCKCETTEGRMYGECRYYRSTRDVGIPTVIFDKLFFPVGFGRHETSMATNVDELNLIQFIRRINVCRTTTFAALKREKEMREEKSNKRRKFSEYKIFDHDNH